MCRRITADPVPGYARRRLRQRHCAYRHGRLVRVVGGIVGRRMAAFVLARAAFLRDPRSHSVVSLGQQAGNDASLGPGRRGVRNNHHCGGQQKSDRRYDTEKLTIIRDRRLSVGHETNSGKAPKRTKAEAVLVSST